MHEHKIGMNASARSVGEIAEFLYLQLVRCGLLRLQSGCGCGFYSIFLSMDCSCSSPNSCNSVGLQPTEHALYPELQTQGPLCVNPPCSFGPWGETEARQHKAEAKRFDTAMAGRSRLTRLRLRHRTMIRKRMMTRRPMRRNRMTTRRRIIPFP